MRRNDWEKAYESLSFFTFQQPIQLLFNLNHNHMKKVFTLFAAGVLAGAMTAEARYWTYDYESPVDPFSIQADQWYALQGGQSVAGGYTTWLNGTNHSTSENLTTDNLFKFVATGETSADGSAVYYLQRYNGQYLYAPGQTNFYGNAIERAWKITVKGAEALDPDYEYSYTDENGVEDDVAGIAAHIQEAKDNDEPLDLSYVTFLDWNDLVVIASATADNPNDPWSTYTYLCGLGAGATAGGASRGTNYNTNTWMIYPAQEQSSYESLAAKLFEITSGTYEIALDDYQLGNGAGEYSQELYDKFIELWERALAIYNQEETASDEEMDRIAEELEPTLDAFRNSGKGLSEGYYILYNKRIDEASFSSAWPYVSNGQDYDAGAMYDGGAVNSKDDGLRWSCKDSQKASPSYADDVDLYLDDDGAGHVSIAGGITYEVAKFVWHAFKSGNKDNQGNDLYYFQNIETDRYIGNIAAQYQPIKMTNEPTTDYTIATNPYIPGWFCFYSPQLPPANDASAPSPAEYSGIHTERNNSNVVAWDWRNAGSCWKVITLTEEQVKELKAALDEPKRLAELKKVVAEAEQSIADGYTYSGYNADGSKSEYANSGNFEEVDGLVTAEEQIECPSSDSQEGNIPGLLDGDITTFHHTDWHGAYDGTHYIGFTVEQPEEALLLKWVKRKCSNYNAGAPTTFELYATNDDSMLDVIDGEYTNADGEDVTDSDYWMTVWTKVGEGAFDYKYCTGEGQSKTDLDAGVAYIATDGKYTHFRMVPTGRLSGTNAYLYAAEFRVYRGAFDPDASLINAVPDEVLKALQDAIALAKEEIEDEAATEATLAALKKAYDEFLAHYPDPNRITTALTEAKAIANSAEEGDDLGYYANGSVAKLQAAIEAVEAQVKELMTVEDINNLLAQLGAALDEFNAALHMPGNGIYVIKSNSEAESNAGRAICATNSSETGNVALTGRVSNNGKYIDETDTEYRPGRYWQLEKVAGGYTYKNLYTGKYLHPYGNTNRVITLSAEPYVFGIQFAKTPGCFNLTVAAEDANGGEHIYANADPAGVLVTWNTAEGRDNSAWQFVAAEASEVNKLMEEGMLFDVKFPNAPQIYTFPVDMDIFTGETGSFYNVVGQSANNDIQLVEEEDALKAGQAYIYIPAAGSTAKTARFYMPEGAELTNVAATTKAVNVNGLVGTFENVELPDNCGIFNANHTEVLMSEAGEVIDANTGYFAALAATDKTGDVTLKANGKISAEDVLGILTIIDNRKDNGIFSISGVRMNSTNNLPAGLYIVGGKKYIVK